MFYEFIYYLSDTMLFYPFLGVFLISLWITFKSRFIQIRTIPLMLKMLCQGKSKTDGQTATVSPRTALFVAMSTSIGIANIAGPVMAIGMGGPGALAGFLVAAFAGAATTFVEVNMALRYRRRNEDGSYSGGPMFYIAKIFSPGLAKVYAWAGFALLISWTAAQANSLSLLLGERGVSKYAAGVAIALAVVSVLIGGIKRIGELNDRLVPFMFLAYTLSTSWVVFMNLSKLPEVLTLMVKSLFSVQGFGGAGLGFGLQAAMRWGLAKGMHASETGVGTSTFPHSAAEAKSPYSQGVISMVSVFSSAFLCMLSGLTIMVSGAWLEPGAQFDIRMFSGVLAKYFPGIGPNILLMCVLMFGFGTILGNSYNGSQCFLYVVDRKRIGLFHAICAFAVFFGCISDVTFLWTIVDFFVVPVVIPNMIALTMVLWQNKVPFEESQGA